jgi:hypothetical protein
MDKKIVTVVPVKIAFGLGGGGRGLLASLPHSSFVGIDRQINFGLAWALFVAMPQP